MTVAGYPIVKDEPISRRTRGRTRGRTRRRTRGSRR
jgi:hypothetical protein